MIGKMAGEVVEDATHQLIPQEASSPVRPGLTPLNGALITSCTEHDDHNGCTLVYQLAGQTDSIVYHWDASGVYTFLFYTSGNGQFTTQTYNGLLPCSVPVSIQEWSKSIKGWHILQNPIRNGKLILCADAGFAKEKVTEICICDQSGREVQCWKKWMDEIPFQSKALGLYYMTITISGQRQVQRFLVTD